MQAVGSDEDLAGNANGDGNRLPRVRQRHLKKESLNFLFTWETHRAAKLACAYPYILTWWEIFDHLVLLENLITGNARNLEIELPE